MKLAQIIIKIEKTRNKLYALNKNPDKLLKTSQELDSLINEYFKLKNFSGKEISY